MIPVILSSDKTRLCKISGDKTAYPVYLTIGNIAKSIRRKPTWRAQILVAYLPTEDFESSEVSEEKARIIRARLFHAAMSVVTEALRSAGKDGIKIMSGDGAIRLAFLILAIYAADHPEQTLVTCTRCGPKCNVLLDSLGDYPASCVARQQVKTLRTIRRAEKLGKITKINDVLKDAGLNFVLEPFWEDLPYCNIHTAITPDVLHQLYQGLVKNIIKWLTRIFGVAELDARFKRLPLMHGVRSFKKGISTLKNVSGPERKEICKQLLGVIIGVREVPKDVIRATRALLEFVYYAQYLGHNEQTLGYLKEALDDFHRSKQVFVTLGARECECFD